VFFAPSPSLAGESAELLALFDQSEVPYSSDCVLECRGGVPYQWETDQAGTPIYVALRSNEHTDLTPESEAGAWLRGCRLLLRAAARC
jgi:hypothetical protein